MTIVDDFVLQDARVVILGLGLMGGSLALALKGKCSTISGVDTDPATLELARSQNIVDFATPDAARALQDADLLILAAPVPVILDTLDQLSALTPNPCIVVDLGSTKVDITNKMTALPERFDPVGAHPICGKEKLSLANADRTLYYAAPFLVTPLERSTPRALSAVRQVINALGARLQIMTAEDHDRMLANTSHLPYLLASALVLSTPCEASSLIGPGFRSASRLAGTPTSMMLGVLMTNQKNIVTMLEKIQDELALFTSAMIENDFETLEASLKAAQTAYLQIVGQK